MLETRIFSYFLEKKKKKPPPPPAVLEKRKNADDTPPPPCLLERMKIIIIIIIIPSKNHFRISNPDLLGKSPETSSTKLNTIKPAYENSAFLFLIWPMF